MIVSYNEGAVIVAVQLERGLEPRSSLVSKTEADCTLILRRVIGRDRAVRVTQMQGAVRAGVPRRERLPRDSCPVDVAED